VLVVIIISFISIFFAQMASVQKRLRIEESGDGEKPSYKDL
jgi:hypothetical protein